MSRPTGKWMLVMLVILHALIVLPLAYLLNVWVDEASTLYTTSNGIVATFSNLFTNEKQAPLYFLLLSIWSSIDSWIFFARLFSVICSLLSIIVFFRLANKIWERHDALTASALFAFHPYLFWASLEIRLYSLVILLTCLLLNFFVDGFLSDENDETSSRKQTTAQVLYAVTASLSLYTNYYLGFPIVGGFAALLLLRRWRDAKKYFLWMSAVGVSILPLLYIVNLQFADRIANFQDEKSLTEGLRMVWNHFLTFALPSEIYAPEDQTTWSLVRLWIVRLTIVGSLIVLIKNKGRDIDKSVVFFAAIVVVSAIFLVFVYFQLGANHIEIRHAAIYFVAIFALVIGLMFKVVPMSYRIFAIMVLVMFYGYALLTLYPNSVKQGDWANVAAFVSANESPGQPIMVFPVFETVGMRAYYNGANQVLPNDRIFSFTADGPTGTSSRHAREIPFLISQIPADAKEFWLLTGDSCLDIEACSPLEKFVDANYTVLQEQDFYREKVRLLRKKQ
ncbi:MAG: glycosyltransferase family 39 protein [Acidobacteria bacterium]|nr:glycosyltransferase family 39 protein [Acidobacteriota bacterium]